ncbi:LysE family translocator [Sagittula sp. MA-2]|uniref:LysE family translocator n=1 Tax=Sagittula sp. MA-2 TaxID=3048007 RepID=UPI0024C3072D|nr:LysE family translocator [Sagittula sp. MA-2]WHZ36132.1 LysE family translocator [Sagittula sp. MA-2]
MQAYLPGFLASYAILLVAVLSPGPAVAMLLGVALSRGRASAVIASVGVAAGAATLAALTLAGVGVLMQQAAWAVTILRMVGATYLLWLAYGSFRKAIHPPRVAPDEMPPLSPLRAFTTGYLMQVTNPKAIVFWIAIASVGATNGAPAAIVALFLLGAFLISLAGHGAYALALSAAPVRALYARARRTIEATLGLFFTLFAIRLATARS